MRPWDGSDDALQTDVYLEALLARHGRMAARVDAGMPEIDRHAADAELVAVATTLQRRLVRFHPSFRFEEGLSATLRARARLGHGDLADADAPADGSIVARALAEIVPFPVVPASSDDAVADDPARAPRRLIVGGAIASGVSLAGAALFAWRRTHATTPGGVVRAPRSVRLVAPVAGPRLRAVFRSRPAHLV